MRISKLLLLCMCCLLVPPAVWAQAANSRANQGILGYLDPRTGAFRPVPPAAEDATDLVPALTTFTGTIKVTITVTIKSAGITNVICSINTFVVDSATTGGRTIGESDTVAATGTGVTRTCSLSIPYSWGLATQASDSMTTSYSVEGGGSATLALPNRTTTLSPLDTRKVPANGTITTLIVAATI